MITDDNKILLVEYNGVKMWFLNEQVYLEYKDHCNKIIQEIEYNLIFGNNG